MDCAAAGRVNGQTYVNLCERAHVPNNSPHSFRNAGQTPGKLLHIFEPAGNMEVFFAEVGLPVADQASAGPPDQEKLMQAFQKYNIVLLETPPTG